MHYFPIERVYLTTSRHKPLSPLLPPSFKTSLHPPLATVVNRHMALITVTSSIATMRLSTVSQDILGLVLDNLTPHCLLARAVGSVLDEAAALRELLLVVIVGVHVDSGDADVAFA